MKDRAIALYLNGSITKTGLARAVLYGWVTESEYEALAGEVYAPPMDYQAYYEAMKEVL